MAAKGARRITIKDIAQMANTSKTTVSFYLNGKMERMSPATQERIRAVIQQTGYSPNPIARGMNSKSTSLLGMIVNSPTDGVCARFIHGAQTAAQENGYRILTAFSNGQATEEHACLDRFLALAMDGIIIQPVGDPKPLVDQTIPTRKKVTFVGGHGYTNDQGYIVCDGRETTRDALCCCVDRGYQQFVLITTSDQPDETAAECEHGFLDAMTRTGKDYLHHVIPNTDAAESDLRLYLHQHLQEEVSALVFAPNTHALASAYAALQDWHPFIPSHVGLLGFDDAGWSAVVTPPVSAIEVPAFEMGQQACWQLLDALQGKHPEPSHLTVPCTVVWRGTTR